MREFLKNGQSISSAMREELSYDKMGNIQSLQRDGATAITYHYTGNRLNSISGGLSGSYSYDAIGNALTDRSGFTYIYNHLNQPSTISKTGVSISYSYDALGNKRKSIGALGSGITQDYVNGIEYTNGILDRIATAEGYITFSGSTPVYQYYLRDHLGNVRTVFSASGGTATVIQQQDYYPFGLRKALAGSGVNAYLYNGKELQSELGQYDYGARFYDPVVGRWNAVDPLGDSYYSWSPYNYGLNNPIRFIDPNGMFADYFDQEGNYLGNDGVDDEKIRIVPVSKRMFASNYNTLPFNFYNMDGSINRQAGMAMSMDISDIDVPDRPNVAEEILGFFYEKVGYSLSELQSGRIDNARSGVGSAKMGGRTAESSHLSPGSIAIEVNYGALGGLLMNAADIKNLFVHEYSGHIVDLRTHPSMDVGDNLFWFENKATLRQLQHPTWNRVSPEFRRHIKNIQSRYLTEGQKNKYFP